MQFQLVDTETQARATCMGVTPWVSATMKPDDIRVAIWKSDPETLLELADYLLAISQHARALAEARKADDATKCRRDRALNTAVKDAILATHGGTNPAEIDDIIARAAKTHDIRAETIRAHWKHQIRQNDAIAKAARLRTIRAMVAAGRSNREIGEKVGLHPNSVARIIRKEINP